MGKGIDNLKLKKRSEKLGTQHARRLKQVLRKIQEPMQRAGRLRLQKRVPMRYR